MHLTSDISQPPAYNEIEFPELARLRARMNLVKGLLVRTAPKEQTASKNKPPPPKGLASEDDSIFVAWCHSDTGTSYRWALLRILEQLQGDEEKEWKRLISQGKITGSNGESLYSKHIRAKIHAAKRAVTAFHFKKGNGDCKSDLLLDYSNTDDDLSTADDDVIRIKCICSPDFSGYTQRDSWWGSSVSFVKEMGNLIVKLQEKEDSEKTRLGKCVV
ncbi:hypothetical protein BGX27_005694 [Mortierella sp. AM989]|nr:hypothetical protein BGX27_005694 [Mortierella sp. AM989]